MNTRFFTPAAFILALICLFLPFISLSCMGETVTFSFIDIALQSEHDVGSSIGLLVPLLVLFIVAGGVLSFIKMRACTVTTLILAGCGILLLGLFKFILENEIKAQSMDMIVYNWQLGYYLTWFFLLAAVGLSAFTLISSTAFTPGVEASGVSSGIGLNNQYKPMSDTATVLGQVSADEVKTAPLIAHKPMLRGISGQYANQKVDLTGVQLILGRDPSVAHLIYSSINDEISRKHCSLYYDKTVGKFILEDLSSNGTFLWPDVKLEHGQPVYLVSGDRFYLADTREMFEVRME